MPVRDISTKDTSVIVTSHLAAPIERVWQVWSDPRQLEKWWGPEGYPATVTEHNLTPGGRVQYYMTGPEGEKFGGYWEITAVDQPNRLEYADGFADEHGNPAEGMPVATSSVALTANADGTTDMVITSTYASIEEVEQVLAMGMEEGIRSAAGQLDALLAA